MCLIPLSTLVTLSRFNEGKEIRMVYCKMLNIVATLQQRCGNVLITSESEIVTTSETNVNTTLIFDPVTTLWQGCHVVAVPAGKMLRHFLRSTCSGVTVVDFGQLNICWVLVMLMARFLLTNDIFDWFIYFVIIFCSIRLFIIFYCKYY